MTGFVELMEERKLLAQVTHKEELIQHLAEKPRTAYVGFDPTADSLHVGSLLPLMALRRWQQCGHRVIALVGGGTAMVGDPTGKTEMRQMMTEEVIESRIGSIKTQLSQLIDMDSPEKGMIVNNGDWLKGIEYIPFLREYGSQFSVNRMLTAECFKSRLEKGLSFLEFNYMILQSFDFLHLFNEHGCSLQMGGDDQWSNMLGGIDLIRRKTSNQAYCLTVPLLVNSQGKKMGKTEEGAIWLNRELTPPYDLFQYFRNIEDDMVEKCLYYFTDVPVDEVARLGALQGKDINEAKIKLAYEVTKLLHGEEDAAKASESAKQLFGASDASGNAPEYYVSREAFEGEDQLGILNILQITGIAPSKAEARRWIQQGGLSIDGEKVEDINGRVALSLLQRQDGVLIKRGKKHYYRLRIQD